MTDIHDFDLFVIGAGSGGVRAARLAGQRGKRVAIAEEFRVGGTCVIRGCVPKKLLMQASHYHEEFSDSRGYGWDVSVGGFSWMRLITAKDAEIGRLSAIYNDNLAKADVTLINGSARFEGLQKVAVTHADGTISRFSAAHILIATGSHPVIPPIPGADLAISSNEAFDLPALPESAVIIGGGYIAVEFAGIFNGLGCRTILSYRGDILLRNFDHDLGDRLAVAMRSKGVDVRFGSTITCLERDGNKTRCHFADGHIETVGCVFYAAGRAPNTASLGLESLGVALTAKGAVKVDAYSRSSAATISAIGDVTDRMMLTPVAIAEAIAFDRTLFDDLPTSVDYDDIATAIFSQPQIGTVGLSERQAVASHQGVDIYEAEFRPLKASLSGNPDKIYMKLVVAADSQRVLGCHVLGGEAGEMIQCLAIAIKMKATKMDFDAVIAVHPTSAEELVTLHQKRPGRS